MEHAPAKPSIQIFPIPEIEYDLASHLKPSSHLRSDFTATHYLCLPLTAANTLGWTLYNPFKFTVWWTGSGNRREDVMIESDHPNWAISWFGAPTFTIFPQFAVQTSPGIDLLVRPVPNYAKPFILGLEGIIETDWLKMSFTLNFKIGMPLLKTTYEVGDPLVQFLPYPREYIETIDARIISEGDEYTARMEQLHSTAVKRKQLLEKHSEHDLDYMRGVDLDHTKVEDHKKLFHVPEFKSSPGPGSSEERTEE